MCPEWELIDFGSIFSTTIYGYLAPAPKNWKTGKPLRIKRALNHYHGIIICQDIEFILDFVILGTLHATLGNRHLSIELNNILTANS